jgi:hypothetical protein
MATFQDEHLKGIAMRGNRSRDTHELLFDASKGDIDAYGELFERYSGKLYNFVYYLTYSREEAQDITSDTFIKVFEALQGRDITGANGQKPEESDPQILTRLALTEIHNEQPDIPVEIKWIKIVDGWAHVVMAPREGGDWGSFYYKKVSGKWTVITKEWGGEIYKGSIPPDAPTEELDQAPAGF